MRQVLANLVTYADHLIMYANHLIKCYDFYKTFRFPIVRMFSINIVFSLERVQDIQYLDKTQELASYSYMFKK